MSSNSNPLVRYAAGWAAIEAGVINRRYGRENNWTIGHRAEAIEIGDTIWRTIKDDEWSACGEPTEPHRQAGLWSFRIQKQIAVAYLPAFQLAARYRAKEDVTAPDAYDRFNEVKDHLIPIVHTLLVGPQERSPRKAWRTLASGLGAAWLLQSWFLHSVPPRESSPSPSFIVTPASLRQANHPLAAERADFNTYSSTAKGRKTPIQIDRGQKVQSHILKIALAEDDAGLQQLLRRIYEHNPNCRDEMLIKASGNLRDNFRAHQHRHKKKERRTA